MRAFMAKLANLWDRFQMLSDAFLAFEFGGNFCISLIQSRRTYLIVGAMFEHAQRDGMNIEGANNSPK